MLLHKWVSGIFIEGVIMRLGSEKNCKVCDFVNGLLSEMAISYLCDQVIMRNAECTKYR